MESSLHAKARQGAPVDTPVVAVYSSTMRVLHWATAALVIMTIPIAWYAATLDHHSPTRNALVNLHRSIGFTILLLTLLRIVARIASAVPALPRRIPWLERTAAHIAHALLYAILIVMPVSGYLNSYASGHVINWFWLFRVPSVVPHERPLAHLGSEIHHFVAWATYIAIAGHLCAIVYHQCAQRLDLMSRMTGRRSR